MPEEYIYNFDKGWIDGVLNSVPVKEGSIVCDVFLRKDNMYQFRVKETGQILICIYGWAFRKNTKENILAIQKYNEKLKELNILKAKCDQLYDNIEIICRTDWTKRRP